MNVDEIIDNIIIKLSRDGLESVLYYMLDFIDNEQICKELQIVIERNLHMDSQVFLLSGNISIIRGNEYSDAEKKLRAVFCSIINYAWDWVEVMNSVKVGLNIIYKRMFAGHIKLRYPISINSIIKFLTEKENGR